MAEKWTEWVVWTDFDIKKLWAAQPTYIISQAVYVVAGLLTLIHAFRKGGRWPYFWLATVLHGFFTDNFWHFVMPEYDNFYHSQTPLMLLGGRLPFHILLLYPAFNYHALYAVSRLNLPRFAEPFAAGLVTVLIDIPYDIVAVKYVHWTWHDTDPNIVDRHYWVPWNSYYFHATFCASLVFFFQWTRDWCAPKVARWQSAGKGTELKSMILASLLGMPGGVLLFVPIYHPLHDMYNIHSEVTFFLLFAIFAGITFLGLMSEREKNKTRLTAIDYAMVFQLMIHFLLYLAIVLAFKPEMEVSTGIHETVGPCNQNISLVTPFGQTLTSKRKYLCLTDYDEAYFDFHCTKKPANGATWYTICGTPFENQMEYIVVLATILVTAGAVFYGMYFKTNPANLNNPTPQIAKKKIKTK